MNFTKNLSGHLDVRLNLWANIMVLAQVVLEIFCSQSSIDIQWESWKKEIIQSWNK